MPEIPELKYHRVEELIYSALAMVHAQKPEAAEWLFQNGFSSLTCCPACGRDGFTHSEACAVKEAVGAAARIIDAQRAGILELVQQDSKRPI